MSAGVMTGMRAGSGTDSSGAGMKDSTSKGTEDDIWDGLVGDGDVLLPDFYPILGGFVSYDSDILCLSSPIILLPFPFPFLNHSSSVSTNTHSIHPFPFPSLARTRAITSTSPRLWYTPTSTSYSRAPISHCSSYRPLHLALRSFGRVYLMCGMRSWRSAGRGEGEHKTELRRESARWIEDKRVVCDEIGLGAEDDG